MKKILLSIVVAASSVAANAQVAVEESKFLDNWSLGIQGGVFEPTVGQNVFKTMRAGVNVEIAKQISPVFGISANYFAGINANNATPTSYVFWGKENAWGDVTPKTAFDFGNLGANALINLHNLFYGYKGQPRAFELVARAGAGWGYIMGNCYPQGEGSEAYNTVTANFGLDFNVNVGKAKALSVNVKPAISFWDVAAGLHANKSNLQLLAGLTYHFKNANGLHYFKTYNVGEMQATIDRLNAELAKKPKEVIKEVEVIREVEKPVEVVKTVKETTQLAPVVIFQLGKSTIDASQRPSVAMIATYMKNHPTSKVAVYGYASPEGNAELNQKLSDARAKAVYDMLVNTYKISPERLSHKGLGVTDELFDENDWNRVATFIEESK